MDSVLATLCCFFFLLTVIHFLSPPSPGCCSWPGAWPQPRLCSWQLLPGNGGLAGWAREEPEGLIHMWDEEKRALLHCQSSSGQCMCDLNIYVILCKGECLHSLCASGFLIDPSTLSFDPVALTFFCLAEGWEEVFRLWLQTAIWPCLQHYQSQDRECHHHLQTSPQEVLVAVWEWWEDLVVTCVLQWLTMCTILMSN